MKTIQHIITYLLTATLLISCENDDQNYDATGTFEAVETIISAQAIGRLESFTINEGDQVQDGQLIGYIDTLQLYFQKQRLMAQIDAVLSRKPDIGAQLAALNSQLNNAKHEKLRVDKLVESGAATTKQQDDINAQIAALEAQLTSARSALTTQYQSLNQEIEPLNIQIRQLDDQIQKSKIVVPIKGTVLTTYTEQYEMVSLGKPLFKLADLTNITLRVFITGDQLPQVKLNQPVKVLTDDGNGGYLETIGSIYWVSDQAEFTPKTVQTRDERANKVYAVKVFVKNDGTYKLGMYGQIIFQ